MIIKSSLKNLSNKSYEYYKYWKNYRYETNIEYYFPLFLEALVSIIVFYTAFIIYLKFIYPTYTENIVKNTIDNQLLLYDLCNIASRSELAKSNTSKDIIYLQEEVKNINTNYDDYIANMNNKYTTSINKLVIFITVIIGVLLLGSIIFCILGFYDWHAINFKGLLLAFILNICFITALEAFLLFVIIPNYGNTSLTSMFYKKD